MSTSSTTTGRIAQIESSLSPESGSDDILTAVKESLLQEKDFHRLFDVKLMKVRQQMGLPLSQPTSLDNVPKELEEQFREAYVTAARETGTLFLEDGRLNDAWAYFRTIGEPDAIKAAIDKVTVPREPDAAFDEIMNLALYEGAHVVRGLEFLLKTHGTCNTVTAFSQLQQQMSQEERRSASAMMVQTIYDDLQATVRREVESRMPVLSPDVSLHDLMSGREWLFADGNYHIDVSHLHSTVGFARALEADDPELALAIELCEYGAQLEEQLQYPGEMPFDQYYKAHDAFLRALTKSDDGEGLDYFVQRLSNEPEEQDKQLVAFVLLDLANRLGRTKDVLEVAATLVSRMEDPNGFSFTKMCVEMGLTDALEEAARNNDDVLAYTVARLTKFNSNK